VALLLYFTSLFNDVQESLAFMFEMSNLHEDSLREYDELELCYSESGLYLVLSGNDLASVLSFIIDLHKKTLCSLVPIYQDLSIRLFQE
jgi:hypothetical protein